MPGWKRITRVSHQRAWQLIPRQGLGQYGQARLGRVVGSGYRCRQAKRGKFNIGRSRLNDLASPPRIHFRYTFIPSHTPRIPIPLPNAYVTARNPTKTPEARIDLYIRKTHNPQPAAPSRQRGNNMSTLDIHPLYGSKQTRIRSLISLHQKS